jgi:hypothetical protein
MSNIIFSKKFHAKITFVIRNFWWTGVNSDPEHKPLCLDAWKNICAPVKDGGLGIRNLNAVNHALILTSIWRIAENPYNQHYQILKSKYFNDTSIWRAKPNIPKSAFWTSAIKILPLLHQNSSYQISQGNISIWSTPWCSSWENIYDDLIIQDPHFIYAAKVHDLWMPQTKNWNIQLIDTLFQRPTADAIKDVKVIPFDEPDILYWKLTPNGKFNTKSAYKTCLQALFDAGSPSRFHQMLQH